MFTINKRTTSLNFSIEERDTLNPLIIEVQEKLGIPFVSLKDALIKLISQGIQAENNELPQGKEIVDTEFIQISNDYKAFSDQVHSVLKNANENNVFTDVEALTEISSLIENTKKTPETITETETVEIERPLSDNEILLSLSEPVQTKKDIIQLIQNNRAKKAGKEMESTSQICEGLIFSESALCNWADDFFTGIASKRKLQKNIKK